MTIDPARGRRGLRARLRVGPRGKALLTLRDSDGSGKVEFWVHDEGTVPANPKASRVGPRWGLVQSDGRVLAAGILYAGYLGGRRAIQPRPATDQTGSTSCSGWE